ncbi:hypothetical protein HK101_005190 [Irineochytrium annulatum]|nr:hypothetical protein HK101_005190 [Irineochytrium annulatum]
MPAPNAKGPLSGFRLTGPRGSRPGFGVLRIRIVVFLAATLAILVFLRFGSPFSKSNTYRHDLADKPPPFVRPPPAGSDNKGAHDDDPLNEHAGDFKAVNDGNSTGGAAGKKGGSGDEGGDNLLPSPKKSAVPFSHSKVLDLDLSAWQAGKSGRWDKFAIALKTGADTAAERSSIQFITFLKDVKNLLVIGEAPGVSVGDLPMIDVYTDAFEMAESRIKKAKRDDVSPSHQLARRIDSKVTVQESSQGWKLDAHKNLPGFEALYKTYPNADWYMMIDDDSYLFLSNLERFVQGKKPDDALYFGNANVFVGCDGVRKFGDGPYFAHGGSGILMSRGALKKIVADVDSCIVKYHSCWAGDIRVALCLRDQGVKLTHAGGFWGEPPNDEWKFPDDSCIQPKVFHHLLPWQIQKLYEIETLAESRHPHIGSTLMDVFHGFRPNSTGPFQKQDRPGHDYYNKEASGHEQCVKWCRDDEKCVNWSYANGKCWLKDKMAYPKEAEGAWAGVVPERYKCVKRSGWWN